MTLTVQSEGAKYFGMTFSVDVIIRFIEKKLQDLYENCQSELLKLATQNLRVSVADCQQENFYLR